MLFDLKSQIVMEMGFALHEITFREHYHLDVCFREDDYLEQVDFVDCEGAKIDAPIEAAALKIYMDKYNKLWSKAKFVHILERIEQIHSLKPGINREQLIKEGGQAIFLGATAEQIGCSLRSSLDLSEE